MPSALLTQDELHKLVVAIANAGFAHRVGLTSDDDRVSAFSRHFLAQSMMAPLSNTGAVVVRRQNSRKAG